MAQEKSQGKYLRPWNEVFHFAGFVFLAIGIGGWMQYRTTGVAGPLYLGFQWWFWFEALGIALAIASAVKWDEVRKLVLKNVHPQ